MTVGQQQARAEFRPRGEDGGDTGGPRHEREALEKGAGPHVAFGGIGELLPLGTGSQEGTFLKHQGAEKGARAVMEPGWSPPCHLKGLWLAHSSSTLPVTPWHSPQVPAKPSSSGRDLTWLRGRAGG